MCWWHEGNIRSWCRNSRGWSHSWSWCSCSIRCSGWHSFCSCEDKVFNMYQPYFLPEHWTTLKGKSLKEWEKLHILHWNAAQLLSSTAALDSESMLSRSKRSVGASTFWAGTTATDSTLCGTAIRVRCGALRTGILGVDESDFSCNI